MKGLFSYYRVFVSVKAFMIAECAGESIYEQHTLPYVYMKREWAEYQMRILQESSEDGLTFKIREVHLVAEGPKR